MSDNVKFMWNGIKVNGELYRAWYSTGKLINHPEGTVTIYARDCKSFPLIEGLTAENNTEIQTDYFEKDCIRITPDNQHYPAVLTAIQKAKEHDAVRRNRPAPKTSIKTDEVAAFINKMKVNHHFIKSGTWKNIEVDYGKSYAKVVSILSNNQRSAVNFIDLNNGDVYRANSWKQKGRKIGHIDTFFN